MTTQANKKTKQTPIQAFLEDIAPYYHGRQVSYADLGANDGETFEAVLRSGLSLNRVLLVEPNTKAFSRLEETVASHEEMPNLKCLNLAASDKAGTVRITDMNDMSTVVTRAKPAKAEDRKASPDGDFFDVQAKTVDEMVSFFPERHVSIMKIDVEGHEVNVLAGAGGVLSDKGVDVVYIEAAMIRDLPGQTYFRDIEDIMASHGYTLFRIYEQAHDWINDRPVLRRVNLAFFSPAMVDRYPMSLMRQLAGLRSELADTREAMAKQKQSYEQALQDRFAEIAQLTKMVSAKNAPSQAARVPSPHAQIKVSPRHSRQLESLRMKLGLKPKQFNALACVLIYFLGVATPLVF